MFILFIFYFLVVKCAIETKDEMGDYIRSYSESQFNKHHSTPKVREGRREGGRGGERERGREREGGRKERERGREREGGRKERERESDRNVSKKGYTIH